MAAAKLFFLNILLSLLYHQYNKLLTSYFASATFASSTLSPIDNNNVANIILLIVCTEIEWKPMKIIKRKVSLQKCIVTGNPIVLSFEKNNPTVQVEKYELHVVRVIAFSTFSVYIYIYIDLSDRTQ